MYLYCNNNKKQKQRRHKKKKEDQGLLEVFYHENLKLHATKKKKGER